jgi:RNA polymerase sigma factor (sigma-70 family)
LSFAFPAPILQLIWGMKNQEQDLPNAPRAERLPRDVDLTALYLREVGSTPLLDREKEVVLASRLQTARIDFRKAALKLPKEPRAHAFGSAGLKVKQSEPWLLQQVVSCWESLQGLARENPELKNHAAFKDLAHAKRRLDGSREAMIEANLRLVAHVAKKFCNQGLPYMDLVQEGNIGLMKAVEKFEHERGYKFSTYAFWWIKQAITRAIADKSRTIRIPVHLLEKVRKVQRVSRELEEELGREPNAHEISEKSQLPIKAVAEILGSGTEE